MNSVPFQQPQQQQRRGFQQQSPPHQSSQPPQHEYYDPYAQQPQQSGDFYGGAPGGGGGWDNPGGGWDTGGQTSSGGGQNCGKPEEPNIHERQAYDPLLTNVIKEECKECAKSTAGPDGFEPAEMALLPDIAYERMAGLLNFIEAGAEWQEGMNNAGAAFMQKPGTSTVA